MKLTRRILHCFAVKYKYSGGSRGGAGGPPSPPPPPPFLSLDQTEVPRAERNILETINELRRLFVYLFKKAKKCLHIDLISKMMVQFCYLRWPVPIYMRVGYVFDSRFSE